jgi:ADP-heptose:LPS heptosyltransferase
VSAPDGWEDVRRLLVIRLDNVGDVVMTGPALRALRAALPEASMTLMASPSGGRIAPLLPWIDDVWSHRAVWQDVWGAMAEDRAGDDVVVEQLRAGKYDAAVILTSFAQSPWPPAYACWRAGIPRRLGQSKEFGGSLLTQWVQPLPDSAHQVDRNLHVLEQAGFAVSDRRLELCVPEQLSRRADAILEQAGIGRDEAFVAIAPFATCDARSYDPQRFAEVVRRLASETGLATVVLGGDKERDLAEAFLAATRGYRVVSLVGTNDLLEHAAVIRRASLMLTNDSGPMHIADAFARPMVVLFSGTELEGQWRPRTSPSVLLRRATPCSPCYAFDCPNEKECLDIAPDEVVEHSIRQLRQAALTAA